MVSDVEKDLAARLNTASIEQQYLGYISGTHLRALEREPSLEEGIDRIIRETRQAVENGSMNARHGDIMVELLEEHGKKLSELNPDDEEYRKAFSNEVERYATAVSQSELGALYRQSLDNMISAFRGTASPDYSPEVTQNTFSGKVSVRESIVNQHKLAIESADSPEEGIKNLEKITDLAVSGKIISEEQGEDIKQALQQSGTDSEAFATAVLQSKHGLAFLEHMHAQAEAQQKPAEPDPNQPQVYGPPVPPEMLESEPEAKAEAQDLPDDFIGPLTAEQQARRDAETQQNLTGQDIQNLNLQEMGPGGFLVAILTILFNPDGADGMDLNGLFSQMMGAFGIETDTTTVLEAVEEEKPKNPEDEAEPEQYGPPAPEGLEQPEPKEPASDDPEMYGPPAPDEETAKTGDAEIKTYAVDNVPDTGVPIVDWAAEQAVSFIGGLSLGDVFGESANPDPENIREVDPKVGPDVSVDPNAPEAPKQEQQEPVVGSMGLGG